MVNLILILTGPIASGKSVLSNDLAERFGFQILKTNELLKELRKNESEETRKSLQAFGTALDLKTKGAWVRDGLTKLVESLPGDSMVVVDSARIAEQIESIRSAFGLRVLHVHLTAPLDVLERRFRKPRKRKFKEDLSYDAVKKDSTERQVETLAGIADVVIDTKRLGGHLKTGHTWSPQNRPTDRPPGTISKSLLHSCRSVV